MFVRLIDKHGTREVIRCVTPWWMRTARTCGQHRAQGKGGVGSVLIADDFPEPASRRTTHRIAEDEAMLRTSR
ncbi:hypothetical protein GA0074692_0055 [Micromonospora pallida]|uniref:Uncharacterized protein n=1 Tax=Micromonospora pallida TaxID=145854 RepID=A0A1C6RIJ2_9ACTN|nr:hypothetical protein GA0074692_0055 [Micromonospora pallida]